MASPEILVLKTFALFTIFFALLTDAGRPFDADQSVFSCERLSLSTADSFLNYTIVAKRTDGTNYNESDLILRLKLILDSSSISRYSQHENAKNSDKYVSYVPFNYDRIKNDGSYFIYHPITLAGLYEYYIQHLETDGRITNLYNSKSCPLLVRAGAAERAKSWSGNPSFLTITAGVASSIEVYALDKHGNPCEILTLDSVRPSTYYSQYNDPERSQDPNMNTVTVTKSSTDGYLVTLNYLALLTGQIRIKVLLFDKFLDAFAEFNAGSKDQSMPVTVIAGNTDVKNCTIKDITLFKVARMTSDIFSPILITERDAAGNRVTPSPSNQFILTMSLVEDPSVSFSWASVVGGNIRADWANYHVIQIQPSKAGNYTIEITNLGNHISGSPLPIIWMINSGYIEPSYSSLYGIESGKVYDVNEEVQGYIVGFDNYNNSLPKVSELDLDNLDIVFVNSQSGNSYSPVQVNVNINGGFNFTMKLGKPGNYTLLASFNQKAFKNSGTIGFLVQSETASVSTSGQGSSTCGVGLNCKFVIIALDTAGNIQSYKEADEIQLVPVSASAKESLENVQVESLGKGYYSVVYKILNPGTHEIAIVVNGKKLKSLNIFSDITEGTKGFVSGLTIFVVMASSATALYIYKKTQLKKMKTQWQIMKEQAYQEYMLNPPSSEIQTNGQTKKGKSGTTKSYVPGEEEEWADARGSKTELSKLKIDSMVHEDIEFNAIKNIAESTASSPLSPGRSERSLFFGQPPTSPH